MTSPPCKYWSADRNWITLQESARKFMQQILQSLPGQPVVCSLHAISRPATLTSLHDQVSQQGCSDPTQHLPDAASEMMHSVSALQQPPGREAANSRMEVLQP